ncbi:MAG: bile acid:sodium symporter family protein [Candidatus Hydrogenedentes bacterium]|nr:bile acid:sodium symporter family protein [Candidatus Hydrogenedentota bacterium]
MNSPELDAVKISFNPDTVWVVNLIIAVIMFGVALDLKADDFKRVLRQPRPVAIGLVAQFVLFPAFTYLLTLILKPHPSIALGMILVAACPGGNMSNFITYLAKGNTALSVSMTAVSTFAAIVMTPFNFAFYGKLNPDTATLLQKVDLRSSEMLLTVVIILGIPLLVGLFVAGRFPRVAGKLHKPFKMLSVGGLLFIIVVAFARDISVFTAHMGLILLAVVPHNALAFTSGYFASKIAGLSKPDTRAVTIEVGIQNSALGLALIFQYFPHLGGMALLAGFWGIWHIVAGLTLARFWSRIPFVSATVESEI